MDQLDIIKKAQAVVDECIGEGITLLGLPLEIDTSTDPTMSKATDNNCSHCQTAVKSTEIKDAVLFLTKDYLDPYKAELLCMDCVKKQLAAMKAEDYKVQVKEF